MIEFQVIKVAEIELYGPRRNEAELYQAAAWGDDPGGPKVFGLVYGGWPTFMCYGLDYFRPGEVLAKQRAAGHTRFYFDAGSNGRPLWCYVDELERVFRELGLLDEQANEPTGDDDA